MQEAIVTLIVAFAVWSVVKRYAPKSVREFCTKWTARLARRLGWRGLEQRIEVNTTEATSCADGCGSCKGCGAIVSVPEARSVIKTNDLKLTVRR